jgi:hypothetical protein
MITTKPGNGSIDLHLHTTHSDGVFSPEQVVDAAMNQGLRAIAVTDHDTVSGVHETMQIAQKRGLECVAGVDISAYSEEHGEIHVLGYFIDPDHPLLLKTLQHLKTVRLNRSVQMLERLQKLGIEIPFDDVQHLARKSSVIGRPHLARAMLRHGIVSSVNEAFARYLKRGRPAFVPKVGLSYQEAIEAILDAGGLPVYAHPGLNQRDHLIPTLLEMGLQGLEVFHSSHSDQDVRHYRALVKYYGLVASGGSDCHGASGKRPPLIGTISVPYTLLEQLMQRHQAMPAPVPRPPTSLPAVNAAVDL